MTHSIAVIPGDGIGPELVAEAVKVLEAVAALWGHRFSFGECLAGTAAVDACGSPLPAQSLRLCRESAAVLIGNIAMGQRPQLPPAQRPEHALLALRRGMEICTNLRPAFLFPPLASLSPLQSELVAQGLDVLMVRDLSGGVIMSKKYTATGSGGREAYEKEYYNEEMIRNTVHWAFRAAARRRGRVASLDKAAALSSSMFWRQVAQEVAVEYPGITLEHLYADDAAMQLIQRPGDFDVLVTSNLFGDILSDLTAALTGAPATLPAASLNTRGQGLYEPAQLHLQGEALAGKRAANPIGLILSASMLLDYSLGLEAESRMVRAAVEQVLAAGYATADIARPGARVVGAGEMGDQIVRQMRQNDQLTRQAGITG